MDQVTVCNRALSVIGTRSTIASMTEQSTEAIACNLHFESACRALLRLAPWSFARYQTNLALIAAAGGTPENPNNDALHSLPSHGVMNTPGRRTASGSGR